MRRRFLVPLVPLVPLLLVCGCATPPEPAAASVAAMRAALG